jgi:hypothetical protein
VSASPDAPGPTTRATDTDPESIGIVRGLLDAEERRDLARYRQLLADDYVEQVNGQTITSDADDAAYAAARGWALSPQAHRIVDDIHATSGFVTVRYRLVDALPPGAPASTKPAAYVGYSVYRADDGHVRHALHHIALPSAPPVTRLGTDAAPGLEVEVPSGLVPDVIDLRDGAPTLTPAPTQLVGTPARSWPRRVLAALGIIVGIVITEPLFAAPVIAMAAWAGGLRTFLVLVPIYFVGSLALSLLVIARSARQSPAGRLERLLTAEVDRSYLRRIRRLVQAGRVLGFVLASMFLGSVATTWLLIQLEQTAHLRRSAAVSSVLFALYFVGFYAGLTALLFR